MMPEPVIDGLSWYCVNRLLLRQLHVVMGLNVNHSETCGIYGIECGPFRNAVYEWTWVDTSKPVASKLRETEVIVLCCFRE